MTILLRSVNMLIVNSNETNLSANVINEFYLLVEVQHQRLH